MVWRAFQGQISLIQDFDNSSQHTAAVVVRSDCILRDVNERPRGAVPVRHGACLVREKDAPVDVALVVRTDGSASRPSYPGDDREDEAGGQKKDAYIRCVLLRCGHRTVAFPAQWHDGLPVFPGPVRIP